MTPREKAKELVEKYKAIEIGSEGHHSWGMKDWQAKECALITASEILKGEHLLRLPLKYWQDVKKEIEKL